MYIVTLKRTASYSSMTFEFDDYQEAAIFMKTAMLTFRGDKQLEDDGIVVSVKFDVDA